MTSYKLAETPARIPLRECPMCEHKIDAASHISEPGIFAEPHEGDFTVCIECGGWLRFGKGLKLKRLDENDILNMNGEEHDALSAVTKAVRGVQAQRSKVRE